MDDGDGDDDDNLSGDEQEPLTQLEDDVPEGTCLCHFPFLPLFLELKIREGDSNEVVAKKLEKRREYDARDVPAPTSVAVGPNLSRVSTTVPDVKQSQQPSSSSDTFIPDSQPSSTPPPTSKDSTPTSGKRSTGPLRPAVPMDTVVLRKSPVPVVPSRPQSKISPPPPPRHYTHKSYHPSTAGKSPRPEHLKQFVSTTSPLSSHLHKSTESSSSPSKTITPPFTMSLGESSGSQESQQTATGEEEEDTEDDGYQRSSQNIVAPDFHEDEDIMPTEETAPVKEIESSKSDIYICQTSSLLF